MRQSLITGGKLESGPRKQGWRGGKHENGKEKQPILSNIKVAAVETGAWFLLKSPEKLQKTYQPHPSEDWEAAAFINWPTLPISCACALVKQAPVGPESTPEQKVEQQVGVLRRVALREVSLSFRELSITAAVRNRMGQGSVTCGPRGSCHGWKYYTQIVSERYKYHDKTLQ